jgi:hypothetical protein
MSDMNNVTPSWARKTQSHFKWGPGVGIVIVVGVIIRVLAVIGGHAGQYASPTHGFTVGGDGPSKHELAQTANQIDAQLDADNANYLKEIKAATPEHFLMPHALAAPGGLTRASGILNQQEAIITKYRTLYDTHQDWARNKVAALYANAPDQRDAALATFDARNPQQQADMKSYWQLQSSFIADERVMVGMLSRNRAYWIANGDHILFGRTDLMREYDTVKSSLDNLKADNREVVERVNASTNAGRAERKTNLGE